MHVSSALGILADPSCNFMIDQPPSLVRDVRALLVEMVLATDMAGHAVHVTRLEYLLERSTDASGQRLVPDMRDDATCECPQCQD